jgi:hypothetical protein
MIEMLGLCGLVGGWYIREVYNSITTYIDHRFLCVEHLIVLFAKVPDT